MKKKIAEFSVVVISLEVVLLNGKCNPPSDFELHTGVIGRYDLAGQWEVDRNYSSNNKVWTTIHLSADRSDERFRARPHHRSVLRRPTTDCEDTRRINLHGQYGWGLVGGDYGRSLMDFIGCRCCATSSCDGCSWRRTASELTADKVIGFIWFQKYHHNNLRFIGCTRISSSECSSLWDSKRV